MPATYCTSCHCHLAGTNHSLPYLVLADCDVDVAKKQSWKMCLDLDLARGWKGGPSAQPLKANGKRNKAILALYWNTWMYAIGLRCPMSTGYSRIVECVSPPTTPWPLNLGLSPPALCVSTARERVQVHVDLQVNVPQVLMYSCTHVLVYSCTRVAVGIGYPYARCSFHMDTDSSTSIACGLQPFFSFRFPVLDSQDPCPYAVRFFFFFLLSLDGGMVWGASGCLNRMSGLV